MNKHGGSPSEIETSIFTESYLSHHKIDMVSITESYQNSWNTISSEYQRRAQNIFEVTIPDDITAYITINNRCPYDIRNNTFYVSIHGSAPTKTAMHELWHFYTWYKYGFEWEQKLGVAKYNEIKEALTVLLNVECGDLLPEGVRDNGYSQHKELREKILVLWSKEKNMNSLWQALVL